MSHGVENLMCGHREDINDIHQLLHDIHKRLDTLEVRVKLNTTIINSIDFEQKILVSKLNMEDILSSITTKLDKLDVNVNVYYEPLDKKSLMLTVMHDVADDNKRIAEIQKAIDGIAKKFGADIQLGTMTTADSTKAITGQRLCFKKIP